jgi:tetratricopeptide (TPR) repeat protein
MPPQSPRQLTGARSSLILLFLAFLSYLPAVTAAGFIWDDPDYVLNNRLLRAPQGLVTIWTSPSSLPQYYPLVHTTYWMEYQLVGLSPHLYHATNVLLHAASAILLLRLLRVLHVPGALLAASLFAVHPVMVESVAWVTERKNTLSLFFYLASAIAYLRFSLHEPTAKSDPVGHPSFKIQHWYFLSLAFFVLALLSKTVTCSLPAAVLLILWWKRRLTPRAAFPLAPFFALGLAFAFVTAYLERTHVGAFGPEFDLSPADRLLIASRATLFYAGKLLWPHPLSFIYPRWQIDPRDLVQWLPLAACLLITAGFAYPSFRNPRSAIRNRGPLTAWLIYVGTLTPALGFVNVYPMRYSFVADHFQYHAAPALLALMAAVLTRLFSRDPHSNIRTPQSVILASVAVVVLSALTFTRTRVYESALTLWTDTVAKNPDSWMPHVNLGHALVTAGDLDSALHHYERAVQLAPDQPETLHNLGGILAKRGRHADAITQYERALAVDPKYPGALFGIGAAHLARNDPSAAIPWLRRAIESHPDYAQAHYHLGRAYEQLDDPERARVAYESAVASDPDDADSLYNLGTLYLNHGRPAEAAECFRRAIAVRPARADYRANLAAAYLKLGNADAALREYSVAAKLDPTLGAQIRAFLRQRGVTLP